jgi:hypothetical protein
LYVKGKYKIQNKNKNLRQGEEERELSCVMSPKLALASLARLLTITQV